LKIATEAPILDQTVIEGDVPLSAMKLPYRGPDVPIYTHDDSW
jgi:hypothetical protein